MELDERKQRILEAVIQDYITSAEPVGSRTIARKYDLGVSAATIRNEMFDLETMGYLEQPHTSAGRTPSAKGIGFMLTVCCNRQRLQKMINGCTAWLGDRADNADQLFRSTAQVLAKITHNVSFVVTSGQSGARLKYVRFLPLDDRRAIMLVVSDTGQVEDSIYAKPAHVEIDELNVLAQKLTERLAGMQLSKITTQVLERFRNDIVDDIDLYKAAFRNLQRAFRKQDLYQGGATELLNTPEFRDMDKGTLPFQHAGRKGKGNPSSRQGNGRKKSCRSHRRCTNSRTFK